MDVLRARRIPEVIGLLAAFVVVGSIFVAGDARAQSAPVQVVHVNVRLQREREVAEAFVERRGTWISACHAPCSFDAMTGERVRIDVDDKPDDALVFVVPDDGRHEYDIEVRRRGEGHLKAGLIAIGAGAISLALGMAIIRGAGKDDLFGSGNRAVADILLLLGAGSAVTGTVLIFRRSTTPYLAPSDAPRTQALENLAPSLFSFAWTIPL